MTKRAMLVIACALLLLLCALSTQGGVFWLLFWLLAMLFFTGFIAVQWTRSTLSVTCDMASQRVLRDEQVVMAIDLRYRCPMPVAPFRLDLCTATGMGDYVMYAPARPYVHNSLRYGLNCPHVGAFPSGLTGVAVRDVFGLFSLYVRLEGKLGEFIVRPQTYVTRPLSFSPGDTDRESTVARAFEDATMPTDLRPFQQGDELKKVHWKLSLRRKELIVRVYDQPQRPDALLLVDCSPPEGDPYRQAVIRDALCEAAASVAHVSLMEGAPVRMPLLADAPVDISASRAEDLAMVQDALAACPFDGTLQFERVLQLETRRMRRTGSTAIFTSRMNPTLADMILRIRRMGPRVRVYLAVDEGDDFLAAFMTRLMRNDVEVETILITETEADEPLEE